MFGYAVADDEKLTEEQNRYYRSLYCGLCCALGKEHSSFYRLTLTYDFVLLIAILGDVYAAPVKKKTVRCVTHPYKPHMTAVNRFTPYAADMNLLLAYLKFRDDRQDSRTLTSALKVRLFRKEAERTAKKYRKKTKIIEKSLRELSDAESRNEWNPELPARIFGEIMGQIFKVGKGETAEKLYRFGCHLGRAVYLMDALVDIKEDLKKKQYNPLIRLSPPERERLLNTELGLCMETMNELALTKALPLTENILLSGIWKRYEYERLRRKQKSDSKPL